MILRPDYIGRLKRNVGDQSQEMARRSFGNSFARPHGVTARRKEYEYTDLFGVFCGISVLYGKEQSFFLGGGGEGPRSKCYGRTAALRLIMQPCDEDH
jgi:hypothetical protein